MAEREGMLKAIRRIEFETRLHSFLLAFLVIMLFFPTLALLLAALEDNRRNPGSWAFDIVMLVLPTVLTLLVYKASKRKYMRQLRDYSFLAALAAGHDAGREAANSDHWLIRMIQPQRKELKAQLLITAQHIGRTLTLLERRSLGIEYRSHWYESPMLILLLIPLPQITMWTLSSVGWADSAAMNGRDTDLLEMSLAMLQVAIFPAAIAVPIFKHMQLREFAAYLRRELGFQALDER